MTVLLWGCFALSGAAALALELLWIRSAALVLGTTAATTATVVAGYFTGLALGAFLARRPAARPVRRYALLELAVAGGALASCAVFRLLAADAGQRALAAIGGLTAFVGFCAAYRYDMPLGPSEVAISAAVLLVVAGLRSLRRRMAVPRPA